MRFHGDFTLLPLDVKQPWVFNWTMAMRGGHTSSTSGGLAAQPERSVVTILVVDTVGSTEIIASIDPDDAQALLDEIFGHIKRSIEQAGGLLVSFAGDGGVAVFGWPGAQEDHADRACEVAWNLQHPSPDFPELNAPDGTPIRFRIGIHSGLVGLRQMKLQGGDHLDLVGGTVHLAAALEKRAPVGEVLLSSDTLELCKAELELNDHDGFPALDKLGSSVFKLCAKPLRLSASELEQRYQSPMVGRSVESETIRRNLPQRDADNRSVAVIGEPGIGKSRIVTNAIGDARRQAISIEVLVYQGEFRRRSTPFFAMRSLIAQSADVGDGASNQQILDAIMRRNPSEASSDAFGVLTAFLNASQQRGVAAQTSTRVSQALVDIFIRNGIREPQLILIEDLHLVDPDSLQCFELLARATTPYPILLLVTGRPEVASEAAKIADTVIELSTLPEEEMQELAKKLVSHRDISERLLEEATKRAGGVPFVLEQILASVGSDGTTEIDGLPRSVESFIHARLNQLTPETKSLAQALSTLGGSAELRFIGETLDIEAQSLQNNLAELREMSFIHPPHGRQIQFRHAILADACATTVGRKTREHLHRRAIETIIAQHKDLDAQYERLAFHAESSGDDEAAIGFLWQAGLLALRSWASGSLLLIFERAVACIDRIGPSADEQFVNWVLLTYTPMLQLGEFAKMNPHLPRAIEIAERLDDQSKLCGVLCQVAMICSFDGRYEEGLIAAQQAVKMADELQHPPLLFSSQHLLGAMFHGAADIKSAIDVEFRLIKWLDNSPRLARLGSAAIPAAITRGYMSWYMMEIGQYNEGLVYAEEALKIGQESEDPYTITLVHLGLGRNLLMLKRLDDAEHCLRTGCELGMRNGFHPAAVHLTGLLAATLARNGKGDEGVALIDNLQSDMVLQRCGELERYYLNAGHAEALFGAGEHEQAIEKIETALGHAMSVNNQCLTMQGLGLRAHFRLRFDPDDERGLRDLELQSSLCERYGLVAQKLDYG